MQNDKRPLSPHLQVYRPQLTSMMSIAHRASGAFLCAGGVLITLGLLALADSPGSWTTFLEFCNGWLGKLLLAAAGFSLIYHWLNGLRHLAWDSGHGLDIKSTYASGHFVMAAFVVLAAALVWFGFLQGRAS